MRVEIFPSRVHGKLAAPPSKSDLHRLLLAAGLCVGESEIKNAALSADIKATVRCLEALGAKIDFSGGVFTVRGIDANNITKSAVLDCGECGTAARFFIPVCLLSHSEMTLTGSERLLSRPMDVYEDIASEQGLLFENTGGKIRIGGRLKPGKYYIPGNISSQFISGLLFALPLLEEDSEIHIIEGFESRPYVDMTVATLEKAGIEIDRKDELTLFIKGGQSYKPLNERAEGDWSNAAFLYALAIGGEYAAVTGTDKNSLQGDRVCTELFEKIRAGFCTIDLSDCPDLAPVLFTVAGLYHGAEFTGKERLRIKESDRILDMGAELLKAGIELADCGSRVTVIPHGLRRADTPFSAHNDHRIAMALAVLCSVTGGVIDGAEAAEKSYPRFFEDIAKAGVKLKYDT